MTKSETDQLNINVKCIRLYLKEKLSSKNFSDYVNERNELLNVLKRTVTLGESDSVLVVGPRGCGKTHVVNNCLADLEGTIEDCDYLVVHLSGLVHTDDNLALRTIIEQLHMNELDGGQIAGSFADNLMFVLQSLKSGDRITGRPILFILDEFQLFCSHRNQTLLYNLLDVSKSAQTPVCIVGLTCRYDITELLEKRVSSRFSHRQILLMPSITVEDRISQFSEYLKIERRSPALRNVSKNFINEWNENIESLLNMPNIQQRLRRQLEIESNKRAFKNAVNEEKETKIRILMSFGPYRTQIENSYQNDERITKAIISNVEFHLICKITPENPHITFNNVEEAFRKYYVDEKVQYLKDLSVLELCLIISMCHQVEIYDGEPFNFEMIAKRYLKFAQQNSAVQITQRSILLKAFERIKELELILPITNSSRNQKKEYLLYNLMVTKSQMKSAVYSYSGLPTDVSQWALTNAL